MNKQNGILLGCILVLCALCSGCIGFGVLFGAFEANGECKYQGPLANDTEVCNDETESLTPTSVIPTENKPTPTNTQTTQGNVRKLGKYTLDFTEIDENWTISKVMDSKIASAPSEGCDFGQYETDRDSEDCQFIELTNSKYNMTVYFVDTNNYVDELDFVQTTTDSDTLSTKDGEHTADFTALIRQDDDTVYFIDGCFATDLCVVTYNAPELDKTTALGEFALLVSATTIK